MTAQPMTGAERSRRYRARKKPIREAMAEILAGRPGSAGLLLKHAAFEESGINNIIGVNGQPVPVDLDDDQLDIAKDFIRALIRHEYRLFS